MREKWYVLGIALVVGFLLFAGNAVLAAQKSKTIAELALYKGPDRQQILEEGAKKEGKVTLYTSAHRKQAVRPLIKAFEKKYPFIKVTSWRGGTKVLFSKTREEYQAGKHVVDVIEGTQATQIMLQNAKMVRPYYSPELGKIEEDSIARAPGGGALAAATRASGVGIAYNTKLISEGQLPKTYEDLLNPKWKGKMPIAGSSTGVSWCWVIFKTYGKDFVERLAKQEFIVHMVSARALMDMIINGEYAFTPTGFDSHVIKSKTKGAHVEWIPTEPDHVNVGQIALPKYPPHPHAAMLLADFELSMVNAEILKKAGYQSFRKDVVPLSKPYKKFFGVKSLDEVKKANALFDRLFLKK